MNAELKLNKQEIRNWIKQWDDQRLAHVYLHNCEGRMSLMDPCGCILGVTLAKTVHTKYDSDECKYHLHYQEARLLPRAKSVERAYDMLGMRWGHTRWEPLGSVGSNALRRRLLSPILKAELKRRDRLHTSKMIESQDAAELVLA